MSVDFDKIIQRRGTGSLKYDCAVQRGRPEDVLPLWVADMDFAAPDSVTQALAERCRHGIFGYTEPSDTYFPALAAWMERRFGWQIERQWLELTPGVVFALAMAVRAFTQPGEGVVIERPVYYPFQQVIEDNGRRVVDCPLVLSGGRYSHDWDRLEAALARPEVTLMLLCSPHNPVGRVWRREELERLGEMCLRHGVFVVSDEIHADFVWQDNLHQVFAALGPEFAANSMICTAPSKTFNLAGLQTSNIFIPDKVRRQRFRRQVDAAGYSQMNTLGLLACETAYRSGDKWLEQLKEYIWQNICYVRDFLERRLPRLRLIQPEGTYLLWVDFRSLGLTEEQRERLLLEQAKLWLDSGAIFGSAGEGFERFNVACPRAILVQAMEQLERAVNRLTEKEER